MRCFSQKLMLISRPKIGQIFVNQVGDVSSQNPIGSVELPKGLYRILLTGSGAYGGERANTLSYCGGGGGSGGCLTVETYLQKGIYYFCGATSVNRAESPSAWFSPKKSFDSSEWYFSAGGGHRGSQNKGGTGGSSFIHKNPFGYMRITLKKNGNAGETCRSLEVGGKGGVSSDNGFGAGGKGSNVGDVSVRYKGANGRVVVTYIGHHVP